MGAQRSAAVALPVPLPATERPMRFLKQFFLPVNALASGHQHVLCSQLAVIQPEKVCSVFFFIYIIFIWQQFQTSHWTHGRVNQQLSLHPCFEKT